MAAKKDVAMRFDNLLAAPDSPALAQARAALTEARELLEHRRAALQALASDADPARRAAYSARCHEAETAEREAHAEVLRLRAAKLPDHVEMCRLRYDLALADLRETRERLQAIAGDFN
jgi:hypothetical protein